MARLSEEKINKIRQSVDIVEVIGNYLPLHKKGKGYWALCPFHDDKDPSLSISSELQIYRCFVCNHSGNVFGFLMDYLKISFIEAVKICADKAGIDVSELDAYTNTAPVNEQYKDLYTMHQEANKIYQLFLKSKDGIRAKEYLEKRHINDDVIKRFQIGFAPNADMLYKAFTQLNIHQVDMARSGLIIESNSRYYDRFKDRIMFPIWNQNGQIIGFSGRIYTPKDDQAKYMNSPESEIFIKGQTLYNYHLCKEAVKKEGFVYVLEGFMDVIALYKAGIENAVAIMGTALTKDHLLMLRKLTDTVHLCLDGDKAGQDAMFKAGKVLKNFGFQVRVIMIKQNMDPDELLENFGREGLINNLKSHISYLEFLIEYYFSRSHMENYDERKNFLEKVCASLSDLSDPLDIDYYSTLVSHKSGFSKEVVYSKISQNKPINEVKRNDFAYKKQTVRKNAHNKFDKSEQELLYYMMHDIDVVKKYESELGFLYDDNLRLIANYIVDFYRSHKDFVLADLINNIQDKNIVSMILDIVNMSLPPLKSLEVIDDYINMIRQHAKKIQIEMLQEQIKQELDPIKKASLLQEIISIKNNRN